MSFVTIDLVIFAVAAAVLAFGGSGVATIIVDINCLFFSFIVFNLIIASGEENLFLFYLRFFLSGFSFRNIHA